ncbi:MAG: histidine kinase [Clostridiales bacterium]|jgi:sensor histidine kinase YesM|nr:histidine kinase [Clostridiales bacterium]
MIKKLWFLTRLNHLNIFISVLLFLTVLLALGFGGGVFYMKSIDALKDAYYDDTMNRLEQINRNTLDQIADIDAIFPLLMSNPAIHNTLDPAVAGNGPTAGRANRLEIERQLSYTLVNNKSWSNGLINAVYVFHTDDMHSEFSRNKAGGSSFARARAVYDQLQKPLPYLKILEGESRSIYFVKSVYSFYTGGLIATVLIDVDIEKWKGLCSAGIDGRWILITRNEDLNIVQGDFSDSAGRQLDGIIAAARNASVFREARLDGTDYFIATRRVGYNNLTNAVAAPKSLLFQAANSTLNSVTVFYVSAALMALAFTILLSYTVTNPIRRMTAYVRSVSDRRGAPLPEKAEFAEFAEWKTAIGDMLKRIDEFYADLNEQKILLKISEIKALQAQIDPHFLFNVLNTIAWRAEMGGNPDVYQMTISLSELLKANTLAKDKDFVTLREELDYVRFYLQLQQQRFDDKFHVEIDCGEDLLYENVPRFCIQPLVENAVCHGLEPLSENGRLAVRIRCEDQKILVAVEDNGAGFPPGFVIDDDTPADTAAHAHIALKNLNQRLILLGGSPLTIRNGKTGGARVSFAVPMALRGAFGGQKKGC